MASFLGFWQLRVLLGASSAVFAILRGSGNLQLSTRAVLKPAGTDVKTAPLPELSPILVGAGTEDLGNCAARIGPCKVCTGACWQSPKTKGRSNLLGSGAWGCGLCGHVRGDRFGLEPVELCVRSMIQKVHQEYRARICTGP